MPPPYARAYNYFKYDAEVYSQANRANWNPRQRQNTISTLWAGSDAIRAHYDDAPTHPGAGPGLPPGLKLIPAAPYTASDAQRAKTNRTLPAPQGQAPHVPAAADGDEEEEDAEPDDEVPAPVAPAQPEAEVAPPPIAAARHGDRLPYDFWPQMPWSPKPDYIPRMTKADQDDKDMMNAWLLTKPLVTSGDESRWHGVKFLGAGSYGAAGLWVQVDATNVITDVMVIKDALVSVGSFRDPEYWRNGLPQEIRIHQLIEERRAAGESACRFLVGSRGHRLMMPKRRYPLYLDHCKGGTLHQSMQGHWNDATNTHEHLPEVFIWYMLKALASACTVLQLGQIPKMSDDDELDDELDDGLSDEPLPVWKSIMHLDIGPANVLVNLGKRKRGKEYGHNKGKARAEPPQKKQQLEPNELFGELIELEDWAASDWDELPFIPVLADFGLAYYSLNDENCPISDNPEDHLLYQVATRYAPEHQSQWGPPWIPLNEKTDVWGIGSIIWSLIAHTELNSGPVREDIDDKSLEEYPIAADRRRNKKVHTRDTTLNGQQYMSTRIYSDKIKDLTRQCLNWDQDERPTLKELLAEADTVLWRPGAKAELTDWEELGLRIPGDIEEFEIGAMCDVRRRT